MSRTESRRWPPLNLTGFWHHRREGTGEKQGEAKGVVQEADWEVVN